MKITIACSKGGSTKTTTAILLATAMAEAGLSVEVWDADPQGDATDWSDTAKENGEPLPFPVVLANRRTVKRPVPHGVDYVLIDTNPHTPDVVQAAIDAADFVIVPVIPSPRDMGRVWITLETVTHRPHLALLCRADRRETTPQETLDALDAHGAPRFQAEIPKSVNLVKDSTSRPRSTYGYDAVLTELQEALR